MASKICGVMLKLGAFDAAHSARGDDSDVGAAEVVGQTRFSQLIGLMAAIALLPGMLQAQSAAPKGAVADDAIQEIIVTAQRKDESLSKTPVAIAVVDGDTLAKSQILSQQDLRTVAPGLSIRAAVNSNQLNYALRGQSEDPLSDTAPGVVPYVNEVQLTGTAGAAAFYDLQSVQVLKGPQGTLFGRSATGGAVLFTTAKPSDDISGYISVTGGNYNLQKYEGAINAPLVKDRILLRVAGVYEQEHGFQTNLFTGGREGDHERYAFRPSLTVNITDQIHDELVIDRLHSSGSSTVSVISGLVPFTGVGPPFIPIEFLYAGTSTPIARATGIGTIQAFLPPAFASFVPPFYDAYYAAGSGHPAGGITQYLAAQNARGPYVVDSDGNNIFRQLSTVTTNATTFDIGPDFKIKNIFGYQDTNVFNATDSDGTPYGISQSSTRGGPVEGAPEAARQATEELQLQGNALAERLSYVTGFYYADSKITRYTISTFFDTLLGGQSQENAVILTTKTYAGYGQATYKLNDSGLAATVGVRYTSERVGKQLLPQDSFRIANPVAPPGYDYNQSTTYNKPSWQFGLQDQITSETLLYAVTRRAYKSGGYNGTVPPKVGGAAEAGDSYKAEQVTDLEVGAKFEGHLGNTPARLTLALFHDWIDDSQRLAFTLAGASPAALTVNVPKGTTYGAEADALVNPVKWLSVGGSVNYIHASYSNIPVFVNGSSQVFDQVPDTPKVTGSLFAEITMPVSSKIDVVLHGDVYDQSKSYTTPRSQDDAGGVIGSYALTNFRVGLEDKSRWSVTANIKNAFNRVYYIGGLATGEIFQINTLIPGQPRTYSVEARYKF